MKFLSLILTRTIKYSVYFYELNKFIILIHHRNLKFKKPVHEPRVFLCTLHHAQAKKNINKMILVRFDALKTNKRLTLLVRLFGGIATDAD